MSVRTHAPRLELLASGLREQATDEYRVCSATTSKSMSDAGFFPPPPKAPPVRAKIDVPVWARPPEGELGTPIPAQRLFVQTEQVAITLTALIAYSTGFSFALEVLLREPLTVDQTVLPSPSHTNVPQALKVAVELDGGERATSLDPHRGWNRPDPPPPFMSGLGYQYGTGQSRIRLGWWVWPIPEGAVRLELEWPGEGIAATSMELEMADVRTAARQEIPRW